jgi:hypothetical protein
MPTKPQRPTPPFFIPSNCPNCAYDRRFPGFEGGGWIQQGNNGPIVPCALCNDGGTHPRDNR